MDLNDEELAMQAQIMDALNHKKADLKQSVAKWQSEKQANEEYIHQMRANKEKRKKEMEEMETFKAQLLAEEEEAEKNIEVLLDDKLAPAPVEKKKEVVDTSQAFKSKEQLEMADALAQRVRPLSMEGLDSDMLRERAKEYWSAFTGIKQEKAQLTQRLAEQDLELKEVQERLAEVVAAKQARKGVDMERLALGPGGKPSKHPPKLQMFSKHENRKGARSYDERQAMYDEGVDSVRPRLLVSVWQAKFSAWMEDETAGSYMDGKQGEEEF